ncbi:hypothetical protein AT730_24405 (plasmid) [Vibrio alginolyticus]|nr:hypothetical protein AT730_24405 [Vibrio alginolyticus]
MKFTKRTQVASTYQIMKIKLTWVFIYLVKVLSQTPNLAGRVIRLMVATIAADHAIPAKASIHWGYDSPITYD